MAKAEVHHYEIVNYNDPLTDLISPFYIEGEKISTLPKEESKYKALILSFTMKPSCYATMFLREIMREGRELRSEENKIDEHDEEEEKEPEIIS